MSGAAVTGGQEAAGPLVLGAAQVFTGVEMLGTGEQAGAWVRLEEGWVTATGAGKAPTAPAAQVVDLGDAVIAPGFVDVHCHGGGGAAFGDLPGDPTAVDRALAVHRAAGATSVMASLVTDTPARLEAQARALGERVRRGDLLGIHLEGPWLSPAHRGAHDPTKLALPDVAVLERLHEASGGAVRMVTLAPELEGAQALIAACARLGIVAALGHTDATYDQARAGLDAGASAVTHLCNAMRPAHHREPGIVVAALEHPQAFVELIADGVHLHPAVVRGSLAALGERGVLITDAMAATGIGDGDYVLGPLAVRVTDGVARLVDGGAIAGSTLTMGGAVAYAHTTAGVGLAEALHAATAAPAAMIGAGDAGRLAPGSLADLVVLDPATARVQRVMRHGAWL